LLTLLATIVVNEFFNELEWKLLLDCFSTALRAKSLMIELEALESWGRLSLIVGAILQSGSGERLATTIVPLYDERLGF